MTMQDSLTNYCILDLIRKANAAEVDKAVTERLLCEYGPPRIILTDQGTQFQNQLITDYAAAFGIKKVCTTAYHPQSNGAIERIHHTLTEYLKKYVSEKREWNECIAQCQIAYNSTDHEATGYAPFELVFGRTPRIPIGTHTIGDTPIYTEYIKDLIETLNRTQTIAAITMTQANHRSKYYYDRKLNIKHFREGEIVILLKEPRKGKYYA